MKKRFWMLALVGLTVALCGLAEAQPNVRVEWLGKAGGAMNVSVDNLPPNTPVTVEVVDVSNGNNPEKPVGDPPKTSDEKGKWPGAKSGGKTGYPETAKDQPGTHYVISVKVNGKTGPAVKAVKPGGRREVLSGIFSLGLIYLFDAVGLTGHVPLPRPAVVT